MLSNHKSERSFSIVPNTEKFKSEIHCLLHMHGCKFEFDSTQLVQLKWQHLLAYFFKLSFYSLDFVSTLTDICFHLKTPVR